MIEAREHWSKDVSKEEKSALFDLKVTFDDRFTMQARITIAQPFKLKATHGINTYTISGVLGPPTTNIYPLNLTANWGSKNSTIAGTTEWQMELGKTVGGGWSGGVMRGYEVTLLRHMSN